MISMLFKFLGDGSPLNRELDRTKNKARETGGQAGKFFGEQFKSQVLRFIGAGAVVGKILSDMRAAVEINKQALDAGSTIEGAQELKVAADLVGLSVKDIQAAAALVPNEFAAMMESIRSTGTAIDESVVKQLMAANLQMQELNRRTTVTSGFFAKLFLGLVKGTEAGSYWLAGAAGRVAGKVPAMFGYSALYDEGMTYSQMAGDVWNDPSPWSAGMDTVDKAAALSAALRKRSQGVAAMGRDLQSSAAPVMTASQAVPFAGDILRQLADEMKKSNTTLKNIESGIQNNL